MVKIYLFVLHQPISQEAKSFLLSQLDNAEIKLLPKQQGKNFELSLIGKTLVKKIIADATDTAINDIYIGKTKHGKPVVKKPNPSSIDFSISHSGSYLAIGICDSGTIGIDIEELKNIDFQNVKNCLSTNEEIYIHSCKEIRRNLENFYEIWTRKEAYVKTLGIGLQKPLPITQFNTDHTPKTEIKHNGQPYHLITIKEEEFVCSVCTTKSIIDNPIYTLLPVNTIRSLMLDPNVSISKI